MASATFGQGTTPATGVWKQLASTAGYQAKTIGQFDAATYINGLYVAWEQYQTTTFSELNDYNGAFSYADNRWEYLMQTGSWPSTHRSSPGHQWGYQFSNSNTNMMYWIASSTQGITSMLYLYGCDMLAWGTCYDIPTFIEGSTLTRPFESSGQTPSGYADYDSDHNVLIWYPDNSYVNNKITACTISTTPAMTCTQYTVTGAPTGTGSALGAVSSFRYNHDDGYFYFYPGNTATTIYRIQGSALGSGANWQSFPSAICTGADCPNGSGMVGGPPPRFGAGLACTPVDHICLLAGGLLNSGSTPASDMWAFSATANAGAGSWTEICGPLATVCGTPGTNFPTWANDLKVGNRMVYDSSDNVFQILDDVSAFWIYPYSAATGNYGRSCSTGCYGIPTAVSPVVGPLNRTAPPSSPSISNAQTGAIDLSVDVAGGNVYVASTQPEIPGSSGNCSFLVPYFAIVGTGNALPSAGTQATACSAIGNSATDQPSDHPFHAQISGTDYEVHSKRNWAGLSANAKTVIQSYSGGSSGTWSGGDAGCFSATCFGFNSSWPMNSPRGLINANGTLALLTVENVALVNPTQDVFLATCNLASLPCTSVTGNVPLNSYSVPLTFTNATAAIAGTNNFTAQQIIYLNGSIPSPFVINQPYFVISTGLSTTNFELSTTSGGSAVVPTGNGTGVALISYVTDAAFAADPSGNQMVCWAEEIDAPGRVAQTLPPQLHCKYWNGATIATIGTGANNGSLNQSLSSWARIEPGAVVYAGASGWFVGYTEQTRTGLPQAYVLNCPVNGSACTVTGGGSLNRSTNDLAFEVSLAADGASLYCGLGDQPAVNSKTTGLILKFTGSAWGAVQSGIVNDSTNGNVIDFKVVVPSAGNITGAWTEGSFGNTPQIFSANFTGASSGSGGSTLSGNVSGNVVIQ
jgi:hypothetical protein